MFKIELKFVIIDKGSEAVSTDVLLLDKFVFSSGRNLKMFLFLAALRHAEDIFVQGCRQYLVDK